MKNSLEQSAQLETGNRRSLGLVLLLMAGLANPESRADGGIVHLNQSQGPFTVTVFTPPEIVANSPADVSVLVQQCDTGEVVLDAVVTLGLTPPPGIVAPLVTEVCGNSGKGEPGAGPAAPAHFSPISATHAGVSTKFLYGAVLILPEPGDWKLQVSVRGRKDTIDISDSLTVTAPASHYSGLLPYLTLPLIIISLFFLNQWLRHRGLPNRATTFPRDPNMALSHHYPKG